METKLVKIEKKGDLFIIKKYNELGGRYDSMVSAEDIDTAKLLAARYDRRFGRDTSPKS